MLRSRLVGAALLLGLGLPCSTAAAAAGRRVGWWWDAPSTATDPSVDNLIAWAGNHTNIVSSVLMRCGPTTINGTVAGSLLPSCVKAIPALKAIGVESELWLGETDSSESALKLFKDCDATVAILACTTRKHSAVA